MARSDDEEQMYATPPLTANRRDDRRDYFCIFNPAAS
jgi:hypothetical protein